MPKHKPSSLIKKAPHFRKTFKSLTSLFESKKGFLSIAKVGIIISLLYACQNDTNPKLTDKSAPNIKEDVPDYSDLVLSLEQAEQLVKLPMKCINNPLPYKSGIVLSDSSDLQMPIVHHPAFYGCFDWHSAVHGHWSLVYLLKSFPNLKDAKNIRRKISANLSAENILKEIEYFSLNKYTASFERTYGWAWLLKLSEELYTWDDPLGKELYENLLPLNKVIAQKYIDYLPKLVYPIRVGEHSNTAFGLSFAYDYAQTVGDDALRNGIKKRAMDFYQADASCPISWEPSGYDFLSPCLEVMDMMRRIIPKDEFVVWLEEFMPGINKGEIDIEPAEIKDRSDGKLVHLDGLNFSRAWCLYSVANGNKKIVSIADEHLAFSLGKMADGDYSGEHWLASFALYALKSKTESAK